MIASLTFALRKLGGGAVGSVLLRPASNGAWLTGTPAHDPIPKGHGDRMFHKSERTGLPMLLFHNWGLVHIPGNFSDVRSQYYKVNNVFYQTAFYLYNVLRAFLRGGYTQRTGRTDSRGGGSNPQAVAVCLKAASRNAATLPCSHSSCSGSSWRHGGPCPGRPRGNAPGWTACSSARRPVSAFHSQIFGAVHIHGGLYALNTYNTEATEMFSKQQRTIVCLWLH